MSEYTTARYEDVIDLLVHVMPALRLEELEARITALRNVFAERGSAHNVIDDYLALLADSRARVKEVNERV